MAAGLKKKIGKGRHRSAIKRERQNEKRRTRNKSTRSTLRTAIKAARTNPTAENLKTATSLLAKAGRKSLVHHRKASRLTSRLTKSTNRTSA